MHRSDTNSEPQLVAPEENVYTGVYHVLLGGMYVSTTLFAVGIVRALTQPRFVPLTTEWVQSHYHASILLHGLASLDPTTLMMVATVVLILTPVARVLVSIYAFAVDRDLKYVVITSTVLFVIFLTVLLGELGLT